MWLLVLIGIFLLLVLATVLDALPVSKRKSVALVEQIEQLLPQTQCGECGYGACRPYAEAIAKHQVDINRCPPGGDITIRRLSLITGVSVKPLAADLSPVQKSIAKIDEELCIGCVKCVQSCPVDAIIGAPKMMHSVIEAECTGCKLCLLPCPVDCIEMVESPIELHDWYRVEPSKSL